MSSDFRILELYSGIGGMHCALNDSGISGEIVTAVDINTVANKVYKYNFPETKVLTKNIQSFKVKDINKLNINAILMSPPCQPFTRNGKYLDQHDNRADSFIYLIDLLEELNEVDYILMENVKGFETSTVHGIFIEKLNKCNFDYQEFLLCPTAVGVPNSRLRYYCIARRSKETCNFKRKNEIIRTLQTVYPAPYPINNIIENNNNEEFILPEKFVKRANVLDVCHSDSSRSCCFTKAYSHYLDGTGSVYTDTPLSKIQECFANANKFPVGSQEFIEIIKPLSLRFFTPKEISLLMSFPENFSFPQDITIKQCYRLLGNSVNVKVISELIKILFTYFLLFLFKF